MDRAENITRADDVRLLEAQRHPDTGFTGRSLSLRIMEERPQALSAIKQRMKQLGKSVAD
jgi:hypothetical protein